MRPWQKITLARATADDLARLDTFDYTKLSAINTCPTWGIIRYHNHMAMPGAGRAMALEAGSAMHECFSVVRLIQLGHIQGQCMREHMHFHGIRLFGEQRWATIISGWNDLDLSISMRNAALECLSTAGYVDDIYDRRRTYTNLETALLYYVQRWDSSRYPIWIEDVNDPTAWVGIEIPFAIKVSAHGCVDDGDYLIHEFIYTGRVDGLHTDRDGALIVQENKTASRLDDAWRMSFEMSHQVTGYSVAASLWCGQSVERALIIGLTIPLPRMMTDGMAIEQVKRPDYMKAAWLKWLEYTIGVMLPHVDDPINAPKHTHSCNRYFRPCAFIPLCASDPEEQKLIFSEMVKEEWSPLVEKAGD